MKGHCLCGAVTITAPDTSVMDACHCTMCRRWGGGPLLSVHCPADMQIEGREHIRAWRSSEWAERAFCGRCGTHLYYRLLSGGDYFAVPAGLFQDGTEFTLREQIFIDEKPAGYDFANDTPKLTGAEVFAKYLPGS
jgi:hypothetical protein